MDLAVAILTDRKGKVIFRSVCPQGGGEVLTRGMCLLVPTRGVCLLGGEPTSAYWVGYLLVGVSIQGGRVVSVRGVPG